MAKKLELKNFSSERYRVTMEEKVENGNKIHFLNIQDKIVFDKWVVIDDLTAIPMDRSLKRIKLGGVRHGGSKAFDTQCKILIEKAKPETIEKAKPIVMSVQVYVGTTLVKESLNEVLWLDVMKQILDEEKGDNNVKVIETNS